MSSQQWQRYEQAASESGHSVSRGDWRLSTNIYLAETNEQAMEDASRGALAEIN